MSDSLITTCFTSAMPMMLTFSGSTDNTSVITPCPCGYATKPTAKVQSRIVDSVVFRSRNQFEIFDSIVRLVTVQVVNVVTVWNRAVMRLPDPAMFPMSSLPRNRYTDISIRCYTSYRVTHTRVISACTRAKSRIEARWCSKRGSAVFAGIQRHAVRMFARIGAHRMLLTSGAMPAAVRAARRLSVSSIISEKPCTYHPDTGVLLRRLGADALEAA